MIDYTPNPIFGGNSTKPSTTPTTSGDSSGFFFQAYYAAPTATVVEKTENNATASQGETSVWFATASALAKSATGESGGEYPSESSSGLGAFVRGDYGTASSASTQNAAKDYAASDAARDVAEAAGATASDSGNIGKKAHDAYVDERVDTKAQQAGKTAGVPTRTVDTSNPSDYVNTQSSPDTLTTAGAAARDQTEEEFLAEKEKNQKEAEAYTAGMLARAQARHDDDELGKLVAWLADKIKTYQDGIKTIAAQVQADLAENERRTSLAQVDPAMIITAGQLKAQANVGALTEIRGEIKAFLAGSPVPDSWLPADTAAPKLETFTYTEDGSAAQAAEVTKYFAADINTRWWSSGYYRAAFNRGRDRWESRFASLVPKEPGEPTTSSNRNWLTWLILASVFGVF